MEYDTIESAFKNLTHLSFRVSLFLLIWSNFLGRKIFRNELFDRNECHGVFFDVPLL
jgi:hypothetical protein